MRPPRRAVGCARPWPRARVELGLRRGVLRAVRALARCARCCTYCRGRGGVGKVMLAAAVCAGAFQSLPVALLLLPETWWLFWTCYLPPCLEAVFWPSLPRQPPPGHTSTRSFSCASWGCVSGLRFLQPLGYRWCSDLGSFGARSEQRVPAMRCGIGQGGHAELPATPLCSMLPLC